MEPPRRCLPCICRLVAAPKLRQVHELGRACHALDRVDGRVPTPLVAHPHVKAVLTERYEVVTCCTHGRVIAGEARQLGALGLLAEPAVLLAPHCLRPRIHGVRVSNACVVGTCSARTDLQVELVASDVETRVDGLRHNRPVHALDVKQDAHAQTAHGVRRCAVGSHTEVNRILAAAAVVRGLCGTLCMRTKCPVHAGKSHVAVRVGIGRAVVPRLLAPAHHASTSTRIEAIAAIAVAIR
mmetsp:Transcript_3635/g.9959  ORF Transcript_3635/g.9959 Transcript_3635/m.9959 type:complete len:240 (-) Transcript_3635:385-1104(-)